VSAATYAGRYELGPILGRGSSSVVYRAHDGVAGLDVALKVVDPRLSWDPEARERLRREVLASRRVDHPGIVQVYDVVEDGDRLAVVMELVAGASLATRIADTGGLPVSSAIAIAIGLLEALAAVHERGVIHRDVRPANILVSDDDAPRLVDFGIARVALLTTMTRTGAILGTPGYQPPELLRGERVDLRADLYGVGLTLFEMLTGNPAFATNRGELRSFAQLSGPPPSPAADDFAIPEWLDCLVQTLLDPHPERRPDGAWSVLEALSGDDQDRSTAQAACRGCEQLFRSRIPFCPRCGLQRWIAITGGRHWVRVHGLDRAEDYALQLRSMFADATRADGLTEVTEGGAQSVILARGVSKASAETLAADARRFGASTDVGSGLGYLQLGQAVSNRSLLTAFGATFLVVGGAYKLTQGDSGAFLVGHSGLISVVLLGFVAFMGWHLIGNATRAVLDPQRLRRSRRDRPNAAAVRLAERTARIRESPVATDVATAIDAYWAAQMRVRAAGLTALSQGLDAALERVLAIASRASDMDALLSGRTAADAFLDYQRAQARRRRMDSPELAALETTLREEVLAREDADAGLSLAAGRVVLAAGLFRRTAEHLADVRAPTAKPDADLERFLAHADLDVTKLEQLVDALG